VELYPNPNGGNFFIKSNQQVELPLTLYIYDMKGKLVATEKCIQSRVDCNINVNLASGVYIIKIKNNNTNEEVIKKMQIL
jgi:Secretion system C-terminal sorting domain